MVMKMKENINALDEINKGACMGIDAIDCIMDKIEDKNFKKVVSEQYSDYKKIEDKITKVYNKYNEEDEPHETSAMNKIMTWYGVEMQTLTDSSDSKIAELLLKGTNMGIIEGRKVLNNKELDKEVIKIINEYVKMQEIAVEKLKEFL